MIAGAWDAGIDFTTKDAAMPDARRVRRRWIVAASTSPALYRRSHLLCQVKSGYLDRSSALAAAANLPEFLAKLPKAELHVHIEGCLTPQLCHSIAVRNGLDATAFDPAEATRRRQCGSWLHGDYQPMLFCGPNEMAINAFLTEYTRCNAIMRTEQDFYELMLGYLERAAENGVVRAEIFFDPQMHCFEDASGAGAAAAEAMGGPPRMPCGVGGPRMPYAAVIAGLWRGIEEGRARFGVDGALILSFLQDRSLEEAMAVLDEALKPGNVGKIVGVGMDNGTGPWGHGSTSRFKPAYEKAKAAGLMLSAHAGEEEGAACVEMCLDVLKCDRIDHGVRCLEDAIAAMRREVRASSLTVAPWTGRGRRAQAQGPEHALHRLPDLQPPRSDCGEDLLVRGFARGPFPKPPRTRPVGAANLLRREPRPCDARGRCQRCRPASTPPRRAALRVMRGNRPAVSRLAQRRPSLLRHRHGG